MSLTYTQKRTLQRIQDTINMLGTANVIKFNKSTISALVNKGYLNYASGVITTTDLGNEPVNFNS